MYVKEQADELKPIFEEKFYGLYDELVNDHTSFCVFLNVIEEYLAKL